MADDRLTLSLSTGGDVVIKLRPDVAPEHVKRITGLAGEGFYDGVLFHRVIPGFMVQGGGFAPGMAEKGADAPIQNEANNGLKNNNYTVAMARTQAPHSASAQFFINVADNGFLNHTAESAQGWGYAVFGKVIDGTDVVDKIKNVRTGRKGFHDDVPNEDVVIEKAIVV